MSKHVGKIVGSVFFPGAGTLIGAAADEGVRRKKKKETKERRKDSISDAEAFVARRELAASSGRALVQGDRVGSLLGGRPDSTGTLLGG